MPAARLGEAHLESITASGPPLPVLLRSLEVLRDMRLAAKRSDIATRHADFERLRSIVAPLPQRNTVHHFSRAYKSLAAG